MNFVLPKSVYCMANTFLWLRRLQWFSFYRLFRLSWVELDIAFKIRCVRLFVFIGQSFSGFCFGTLSFKWLYILYVHVCRTWSLTRPRHSLKQPLRMMRSCSESAQTLSWWKSSRLRKRVSGEYFVHPYPVIWYECLLGLLCVLCNGTVIASLDFCYIHADQILGGAVTNKTSLFHCCYTLLGL